MAKYRMKPRTGPHYTGGGRLLKPGDVIDCEPHELVGAIDKFECLEPEKVTREHTAPTPVVGLTLEHRGGGRYNVISDTTNEPVNTSLLSREDAENLIRVSGETTGSGTDGGAGDDEPVTNAETDDDKSKEPSQGGEDGGEGTTQTTSSSEG